MSSRRNASVVVALGGVASLTATGELLAESFDRPAGRDDEPSGGSPCPDRHRRHEDNHRRWPGRDRDGGRSLAGGDAGF